MLALRTGWRRRRLVAGVADGHIDVENFGLFWKITTAGMSANPWHVVIDRVFGCIVWSTLKSAALELRPRQLLRRRRPR
jgi:hypothetical protein